MYPLNISPMAIRIFIKFRTDQVPGPSVGKDLVVAKAACSKLLDREIDFGKDFIHSTERSYKKRRVAMCWSTAIITIHHSLIQKMLSYTITAW